LQPSRQKEKAVSVKTHGFFFLQPFIIKGVYLLEGRLVIPSLYFGYLSLEKKPVFPQDRLFLSNK